MTVHHYSKTVENHNQSTTSYTCRWFPGRDTVQHVYYVCPAAGKHQATSRYYWTMTLTHTLPPLTHTHMCEDRGETLY